MRDDVRDALRASVSEVLALAPAGDEDLEPETVSQLLDTFGALQLTCQQVARLGHADAAYEELRKTAEKLSSLGLAAQRALAEAEEVHGVNSIFLTPQRLAIGALVLGAALLLRAAGRDARAARGRRARRRLSLVRRLSRDRGGAREAAPVRPARPHVPAQQ